MQEEHFEGNNAAKTEKVSGDDGLSKIMGWKKGRWPKDGKVFEFRADDNLLSLMVSNSPFVGFMQGLFSFFHSNFISFSRTALGIPLPLWLTIVNPDGHFGHHQHHFHYKLWKRGRILCSSNLLWNPHPSIIANKARKNGRFKWDRKSLQNNTLHTHTIVKECGNKFQ